LAENIFYWWEWHWLGLVPAIEGVVSSVCHGVGVCRREGLKTKAVKGKCLVFKKTINHFMENNVVLYTS
jgi:hypothetical protein